MSRDGNPKEYVVEVAGYKLATYIKPQILDKNSRYIIAMGNVYDKSKMKSDDGSLDHKSDEYRRYDRDCFDFAERCSEMIVIDKTMKMSDIDDAVIDGLDKTKGITYQKDHDTGDQYVVDTKGNKYLLFNDYV